MHKISALTGSKAKFLVKSSPLLVVTLVCASKVQAAPIQFAFLGPCSGETVIVNNRSYVGTVAHCFTAPLAEQFDFSIEQQKQFLGKLQAKWISTKPENTVSQGKPIIDGAILIPSEHFFPKSLPKNPPGVNAVPGKVMSWHKVGNSWEALLDVKFLSDNKAPSYLSTSPFNSLKGLSMTSRFSGHRDNLANPQCYRPGDPFIPGDSGSAAKKGASIFAFFTGSNHKLMRFFPADGSKSKTIPIPREISNIACGTYPN